MIGELDSRPEGTEENSSATRSDGEFSASEKKCIASAMNILVYASNTEKRLREKLEGVSDQWSLKTVWGVGYKFEVL